MVASKEDVFRKEEGGGRREEGGGGRRPVSSADPPTKPDKTNPCTVKDLALIRRIRRQTPKLPAHSSNSLPHLEIELRMPILPAKFRISVYTIMYQERHILLIKLAAKPRRLHEPARRAGKTCGN